VKARSPAVPAILIGAVLAAVLAVMGVLHAIAPDREALRAELDGEIDRLEARSGKDPVREDRRIEELLEVEEYRRHAPAQRLRLERLHGTVHPAARADEAARRVVPEVLARGAALDGMSIGELRRLDDEVRSLLDRYGSTRFGPALVECRGRLAATMAASAPTCSDLDHFRLLQEVEKDRLAGRYAGALSRIAEAAAGHPRCASFQERLRRALADVRESGSQAAGRVLRRAESDRSEGRREEARRSLDRALPEFKGLPEEGRLRSLLEDLRRP